MKRGKKHREVYQKVDRFKEYGLLEAVDFLKGNSVVKFDETVEISVMLGVDPRKSDQAVRGAAVLPNGLGKTVRVLAFVQGEKETEAKEAGADYTGGEDIAEKIKSGWLEFDAVVATPDMMRVVGKLGKILGTRGLMPNPKVGTVTMEVGKAVEELKKGKVEFRVDKGAILHAPLGKLSFESNSIIENAKAFFDAVLKAKPSAAKGQYIKKVTLTSTMGQGLKINVNDLK
ncbi:50S ribosomal protein L1 [Chitinispirillales bacterium ANBcel5]|uniref:50S ribosomal protein L1 n=1 Tax=Cellulosispirillum alkaliphilum TaxID=3039283 RepID=UPI002A56BB0A|nr:50S ribosomal protein L1 [Chitinispirillales bacterium ANBcel5]